MCEAQRARQAMHVGEASSMEEKQTQSAIDNNMSNSIMHDELNGGIGVCD
jgi:hypothetical protein